MESRYSFVIYVTVLGLLLVACLPPTQNDPATTSNTISTTPSPSNQNSAPTTSEEMVNAAWTALNSNNFDEAIENAQRCIDSFESEALKQQKALTQSPPTGAVSDSQKKAIIANWALNDVGTACLIRGQALHKQGKIDEAKNAYQKAKSFVYARTWDPKGWFWSPAEEASRRLEKIP